MAKRYDVKITLKSQLRKCPAGHCVGDEFLVGRHTPAGMCLGAFNSLLPFITTLRFGGSFHGNGPRAGMKRIKIAFHPRGIDK